MITKKIITYVLLVVVMAVIFGCLKKESTKTNIKYFFIATGQAGSITENTLTINNINEKLVYFSDRPNRIAGKIKFDKFMEIWDKGNDSFKYDPPNAGISVKIKGEDKIGVIELLEPILIDNKITFKIKKLDFDFVGDFESIVIFVDSNLAQGSIPASIYRSGKLL